MPQEVFDEQQLSAMRLAIDQLMDEFGRAKGIRREKVAHAVFLLAAENQEFDATALAQIARKRLVRLPSDQVAP